MVIKMINEILKNLKINNFVPANIVKQHWTGGKYSYKNHPRPTYGILLMLQGRIDFVSENETLKARAGDIIFMPKGSRYEAVFKSELGEINDCLISFTSDCEFCFGNNPVKLFENASSECAEAFEKFIEESYFLDKTSLKCRGLLYLLLDVITGQNNHQKGVVELAKAYLSQSENIKISEIAKKCHISESGLRKQFKDITGVSLSEYRLNLKISKAKYLLEATPMSVKEIADELSFFDEAYFCHTFKKRVGITPKQYLKSKKRM